MITLKTKEASEKRRKIFGRMPISSRVDTHFDALNPGQNKNPMMSPNAQLPALDLVKNNAPTLQMAQNPPELGGLCQRCRDRVLRGQDIDCPDCEKKLLKNMLPSSSEQISIRDAAQPGPSIQLKGEEETKSGASKPSVAATPKCNGRNFNSKTHCCTDGELRRKNPVENLDDCPDRVTNQKKMNEYDGCSVPWWLTIGQDKDNPAGAADTHFSDKSIHGKKPRSFKPTHPCDIHDKAYQTCWPSHSWEKKWKQIDQQLFQDSYRVCQNSTASPVRKLLCYRAVNKAKVLLPLGSWDAFVERQKEYCNCCPDEKDRDKDTGKYSTTSDNVWMVSDPLHWDDSDYLLKKLPVHSTVVLLDEATSATFNQTSEQFQWWHVSHNGQNGWVMKTYLSAI